MNKDELIKSLQKSFNESANLLIEEIKKSVPVIVHSKVEIEYKQIIKKLNDTIERSLNELDKTIEALIEVTSHVMVQNKILSELLFKKGIITSDDITYLEKELDKKLPSTIVYVNKSVKREKVKKR